MEESDILSGVKSTGEMDQAMGFLPQQDDGTVEILHPVIQKLHAGKHPLGDGKW